MEYDVVRAISSSAVVRYDVGAYVGGSVTVSTGLGHSVWTPSPAPGGMELVEGHSQQAVQLRLSKADKSRGSSFRTIMDFN